MRKLTKEERKMHNEYVDNYNMNMQRTSDGFGFLTIGFFIGAVFTPAEFAIYLIGAAAFCGLIRYITSKLVG